jgi:PP-loop superfamily ATP-utilizing enzyme
LLLQHHANITTTLKKLGYVYITIDLEGFHSGSMDQNI